MWSVRNVISVKFLSPEKNINIFLNCILGCFTSRCHPTHRAISTIQNRSLLAMSKNCFSQNRKFLYFNTAKLPQKITHTNIKLNCKAQHLYKFLTKLRNSQSLTVCYNCIKILVVFFLSNTNRFKCKKY